MVAVVDEKAPFVRVRRGVVLGLEFIGGWWQKGAHVLGSNARNSQARDRRRKQMMSFSNL